MYQPTVPTPKQADRKAHSRQFPAARCTPKKRDDTMVNGMPRSVFR